jgi:hypothetical protein
LGEFLHRGIAPTLPKELTGISLLLLQFLELLEIENERFKPGSLSSNRFKSLWIIGDIRISKLPLEAAEACCSRL